jgi:hypothetical protein
MEIWDNDNLNKTRLWGLDIKSGAVALALNRRRYAVERTSFVGSRDCTRNAHRGNWAIYFNIDENSHYVFSSRDGVVHDDYPVKTDPTDN